MTSACTVADGSDFSPYLVKTGHNQQYDLWGGDVVDLLNSGLDESPFCISGMHCVWI